MSNGKVFEEGETMREDTRCSLQVNLLAQVVYFIGDSDMQIGMIGLAFACVCIGSDGSDVNIPPFMDVQIFSQEGIC